MQDAEKGKHASLSGLLTELQAKHAARGENEALIHQVQCHTCMLPLTAISKVTRPALQQLIEAIQSISPVRASLAVADYTSQNVASCCIMADMT